MTGEPIGSRARPTGDDGLEQPTRAATRVGRAIVAGRAGRPRPVPVEDHTRPTWPTWIALPWRPTEAASPGQPVGAVTVPTAMPDGREDAIAGSALGEPGPGIERAWRHGRLPVPARRPIRRRLPGALLTMALLAAAGTVLYLRFHHPPLRVTGVVISNLAPSGCGAVVSARISTNGGAGSVSYQWLAAPGQRPVPALEQPVPAGQREVDVTLAIRGGRGAASENVTLKVTGPGAGSASAVVDLSC